MYIYISLSIYIYIYIYICIYIYIYIYIYIIMVLQLQEGGIDVVPWLRRNGVNTNGAAAKVINFDRLGKKVRPSTSGKIKVG